VYFVISKYCLCKVNWGTLYYNQIWFWDWQNRAIRIYLKIAKRRKM